MRLRPACMLWCCCGDSCREGERASGSRISPLLDAARRAWRTIECKQFRFGPRSVFAKVGDSPSKGDHAALIAGQPHLGVIWRHLLSARCQLHLWTRSQVGDRCRSVHMLCT
jgi:hypothetical protein